MSHYGYPPLEEQVCATCRFFCALDRRDQVGACRVNPPQLLGPYELGEDSTTYGAWPVIHLACWCGEWAPLEASA